MTCAQEGYRKVDVSPDGPSPKLSAKVDESRLWSHHLAMARIGQTAQGGVNRQALSPEDCEARILLKDWASTLGLARFIDEIGNMFFRLEGTQPHLSPVLVGSHLDSQPNGGQFDGTYGVLAALETAQALIESGIHTLRPIEVVVWTNEEGSRFIPGCMGSKVFADPRQLRRMLAVKDSDGVAVGEALAQLRLATVEATHRNCGGKVAAYVEAHIEQGPELERQNKVIGIVEGIQGRRPFRIEVEGEAAHAGTTARRFRKDALSAAVRMISTLEGVMTDPVDRLRFTVGRLVVLPNSPSVVPASVLFTIDLRHPSNEMLDALADQVQRICVENASPCNVTVTETNRLRTVHFSSTVQKLVETIVIEAGISFMRMFSGAGHDAENMHDVCPTGMIFVPCEGGISHSPLERAKRSDMAVGARVLASVVAELANRVEI